MIRLVAVLVFFIHFAALKGPKPVRIASRILFGVPGAALLIFYTLSGRAEDEDVLYYLPLLILTPLLLAELLTVALKWWRNR